MSITDTLLRAVRDIEPIIRQYARDAERDRKLSSVAQGKLSTSRAFLFEAFKEVWQSARAGQPITLAAKGRMQLAMTHATQECTKAVGLIQEIAGASAIREEHQFEQHFRDVHVIAQHGFINAAKLESVGQILLGIEPEWPFFQY